MVWEPEDIHTDPSLSTTFSQFKKYIIQFQQIHLAIRSNIFWEYGRNIGLGARGYSHGSVSLNHLSSIQTSTKNSRIYQYTLQLEVEPEDIHTDLSLFTTFAPFQKYIFQYQQIHLAIWTNILCNLEKYILLLGQIHFAIWTYTSCNLRISNRFSSTIKNSS